MSEHLIAEQVVCHHCGDTCEQERIIYDDKNFCCPGCRAVYELFIDTGLQDIYADASRLKPEDHGKYDYLDNLEIANALHDFRSEDHNAITLTLPAIHCSSCVYLLENLRLFHDGIIRVSTNFVKQEVDIHYNPQTLSLKQLANLLHRIGYPPQFKSEQKKKQSNQLSIKIGVAAFCFGNIMLLSFPEYFGFNEQIDDSFQRFFAYLNIALALPVLFYSGIDYLRSAWKGLKHRFINIDVPIALGIITLFARSVYEITSQTGPGYLDSLAGLVFFLLIGKWFQSKTYENLSFERDYKSYFPLAAYRVEAGTTKAVPIAELEEGDNILIRNQEIIPADAVLKEGKASIDYSFVTGEEKPIKILHGETLFAGGRQVGESIRVQITKKSSQSYLTSLWNNQAFKTHDDLGTEAITNQISKYFTVTILLIATLSAIFWALYNPENIWQVITAVLIVACPCALALSAPFTNGNLLRIFGKNKFYLKNALSVEKLSRIDAIVFDKTGTLTESNSGEVQWIGELSEREKGYVRKLSENSMHPLSIKIKDSLPEDMSDYSLAHFKEIAGSGLQAIVDGHYVKLGSASYIDADLDGVPGSVYLSVDDEVKGRFKVKNQFRAGLADLIRDLPDYKLTVLSGDNDQERSELMKIFPSNTKMLFKQQPQDKLEYIKHLQAQGQTVMMLGDGLNDAGALKQSNVGIAVTEDVSTFSPACDGILEGGKLQRLGDFLGFGKVGKSIIYTSFTLSFLYNIVGLGFAVSGMLTPIFAAILMPLSSITIVAFTTLSGNYFARKKQLI
ncbi:MAG: heavy metal translocating P-type ATPase metal-binding domain-containing protein [Fulvivirga sp.]